MANKLAALILNALPQTQCARCGYPDCAAYAQAVAEEKAAINQCPPGGTQGIARLAALTGQPIQPLNPENGKEGPRAVAVIDETWCIGCALCLKACPTDAIVGCNKQMHTVLELYCTGCELCLPVCPVDCIAMDNVTGERSGWAAWSQDLADAARARYGLHMLRQERSTPETAPAATHRPAPPETASAERKRKIIEAALARARAAGGKT